MAELEATVGQIGEQRLLFMSALVIADELFDAQRQVDGLKSGRIPPQAAAAAPAGAGEEQRSEEHTSELQSLMRISYAVFCLTKKNNNTAIPQYQCPILSK